MKTYGNPVKKLIKSKNNQWKSMKNQNNIKIKENHWNFKGHPGVGGGGVRISGAREVSDFGTFPSIWDTNITNRRSFLSESLNFHVPGSPKLQNQSKTPKSKFLEAWLRSRVLRVSNFRTRESRDAKCVRKHEVVQYCPTSKPGQTTLKKSKL